MTRTARRSLIPAAALGAFLLAGLPAALAAPGDETVYTFDVQVAPVSIEGSFPLTVTLTTGDVTGTLTAQTSAKGKVTGTLALGGMTFDVTGSVSYGATKSKVTLVGKSGKNRIDLSGALAGTSFSGTSKGKGVVADGKNPFVLDLATSQPTTASFLLFMEEKAKGAVKGTGEVISNGDKVALRLSGKTKKFTVAAGKTIKFTAKLAETADYTWTSHGFGANAAGAALQLTVLPAPAAFAYSAPVAEYETEDAIAANVPVGASNPFGTWTISSALPAGLSFDTATGVITGTPSEIRASATYTVTATNPAGAVSAGVDITTRINRAKSFAQETRALDDSMKRHFLTRTEFGVTGPRLANLNAQGLDAYVDTMLVFQSGTPAQTAAFQELVNESDPVAPVDLRGRLPDSGDVSRWMTNLLVNAENPFQENLGFFWHDHFGVSTVVFEGGNLHFVVDHVNLVRTQGNGNAKDFLLNVARDPAMLSFLNGISNTKNAPNENFAREWWELFTLGVDNQYTQADIVEASKAWTGWRQRNADVNNPLTYMAFDTNRHHTGNKTLLGVTIPGQNVTDDYAAVRDITFNHVSSAGRHSVADFLAKKLFEHFCYDAPNDELVKEMGDSLHAGNYELTPFLRTLLKSEAFFSPKARKGKVKNALEFGVNFVRSTTLQLTTDTMRSRLTTLGQVPSQPPTVNGWPLGELWLSSQGMVDRTNLAYSAVEDTTRQRTAGIDVVNIMPALANPNDAAAVVDHMANLLDVRLSATDRTELTTYLNTTRNSNGTINSTVPFNANDQAHRDERVRGLILVLAQHPDFHVR